MKHRETSTKLSLNLSISFTNHENTIQKTYLLAYAKNNIANQEELFPNEKPRVRKNSLLSRHKNKYLQLTMKPKLRAAAGLVLAALLLSVSTHLRAQDCLSGLPESIKSTIEQDNWKIVQPGDIPMDDWKLWKNTHQGQCPGVAAGNFFPKADSSFIVALIQGNQKNPLEQVLLVTLKKGQPTTAIVISPIAVTTPATVWKLPPGHYLGVDGTKASISRDSFVFEQVASSAKQFYYQGSNLKSFIISN